MLLKDALEVSIQTQWKTDILETVWIEVKKDYLNEKYYLDRANNLPKWRYFLSDLDWTFYRWFLIKDTFTLFVKYFKELDIDKINLSVYKEFIEDYQLFRKMEKQAFNKQIEYLKYIYAWLFILFKYASYANWDIFLFYLKEHFYKHEKVRWFRFSLNKLKEILENDINFMFVSWSSNFIFDIYLWLLRDYITNALWVKAADKIYGFSSYVNFNQRYVYNLNTEDQKFNFILKLKELSIFKEIIWGMWDTESDYGIANSLNKWKKFYFVNPTCWVIKNHNLKWKEDVDFIFIYESKDLIFQYNLWDITVLN